MRNLRLVLVGLCLLGLGAGKSGCGGGGDDPGPGAQSVVVTPSPLATAADGASVTFTATLKDAQGKAVTPQPSFVWSSDNPVATLVTTGTNTASATIHAQNSGGGTCATIRASPVGDPATVGISHVALAGSTAQHPCPPQ